MATERLSNLGYLGLKKEATKGTALTPDVYVELYEESLTTDTHLDEDTAIIGNKFARFQVLQGQRSHKGDLKVLAEPNTAARFLDMLLTKGSTSGAGPYTHPFTLSNTSNPNSYTVDILRGQIVFRYMGVEASKIDIDFDDNKMIFTIAVSALKSFSVREISAVTGSGTYTVTFKTNYDPSPTDGLVAGDLIRVFLANGSTIDATVSSVVNGTQITTTTNVSTAASGDYIALRPATPSLNVVTPFLWSRTEFRFSDTASNALTATQTRCEKGTMWTAMHNFEDEEGAKRSGGFDPAALVRKKGDLEFNAKLFFDTPEDLNRFLTVQKRACVVRHFSETGYELRVTINNIKASEDPINLKDDEIIYSELKFMPVYDSSDGQGFDIKVLNNISTI